MVDEREGGEGKEDGERKGDGKGRGEGKEDGNGRGEAKENGERKGKSRERKKAVRTRRISCTVCKESIKRFAKWITAALI